MRSTWRCGLLTWHPLPRAGVSRRAQQAAVRAPQLTPWQEAAALPFAALTAWRALEGCAGLGTGESLLVLGAGGAVGAAAVQLALSWGALPHVTCRPRSAARLTALGALSAGDADAELTSEALRLGWPRFDVVLDAVGSPALEEAAAALLRPQGRLVTLHGGLVRALDARGVCLGPAAALAELAGRRAELATRHGVGRYSWAVMRQDGDALGEIARLAGAGQLSSSVGRVLPLESAGEAQELAASGEAGGKVVLDCSSPAAAEAPGS